MGSRRKGRILAMQALYAWELAEKDQSELCEFPWVDESQAVRFDEDTRAFSRMLVAGVLENIAAIDESIVAHLEHWNFDRIALVDLATLRLAVYSLLYQPEIPANVTIDEAIEIAKEYSGEDSYRFVNGVLDGIRKEVIPNRG